MSKIVIAVVSGLVIAAIVVTTSSAGPSYGGSLTTPAWARPLSGVRPYAVQRNYGTSRGLTCDLRIYTTNRAALDGRATLRPGDVTATVCVIRRVQP